jgi:hypothetical protein
MTLSDDRLLMKVRPAAVAESELDVVMLGHCRGQARWQLLLENEQTIREIALLGFNREIEQLKSWFQQGLPAVMSENDQLLRDLYLLPIPILNLAHFQVLFPDARKSEDRAGEYRSQLAGSDPWLPQAIQDFFASGQQTLPDGGKKLWLIRVPESQGQQAFMPDPYADFSKPSQLTACDRALLIAQAGLLCLPDLERIQIPANLQDVRRLRLVNPAPVFLPCTRQFDDGHRERRRHEEIPNPPATLPLQHVIVPVMNALKKKRPDMQCLFTLPLEQVQQNSLPMAAASALQNIDKLSRIEHSGIHAIQFLFPYLSDKDRPLMSPCGLIAGMMAETSYRDGAWRSIAGRPLPGLFQVFPDLHRQQVVALRDQAGVGVITTHKGRLQLDDERRAAPVVGAAGFHRRTERDLARFQSYQSGEVGRFLGWLHRQLLRLGEVLLFNEDVRDPVGQSLLNQFFTRLHALGALRGSLPEQAFSIAAKQDDESTVIYEIELAPVFPIDRIVLNFSHNRGSNEGLWRLDVKNG